MQRQAHAQLVSHSLTDSHSLIHLPTHLLTHSLLPLHLAVTQLVMDQKDERMKATTEMLNAMRHIKLAAQVTSRVKLSMKRQ